MAQRTLIIGLDGATFDLLKPMIERGFMPNLGRLISDGVHGTLTTCFPPNTGPAWTSIATGKNPGKHGIFDFFKNSGTGSGKRVINSADVLSKTLWEILSDYGKQVGVINVPVTYPPKKVNGFIVSCMLTPSIESGLTYPADLTQEILREIGDYIITVNWTHYGEKNIKALLSDLMYCHLQRRKAVLYLMEQKSWDFLMVVFTGTDRIQHALWNYLDPNGFPPELQKDPAVEAGVISYFQELDSSIGLIRDHLDQDTTLLIISDHGFGPLGKKVYVNRWLQEHGYLSVNRRRYFKSRFRGRLLLGLRGTVSCLVPRFFRKKLIRRTNLRKFGKFIGIGIEDRFTQFYQCVDWHRTKAYMSAVTEQAGIYINLQGREPDGIVPQDQYESLRDEIIGDLKTLKDPETLEPLIKNVMKREEYYHGPFIDWAPDILFTIKDCEYRADMFLSDTLFEDPDKRFGWGSHRMEGIFIAWGNQVKKGETCHLHIFDIFPTVLYGMGLPIPDDVDGRVALEIFNHSFNQNNLPEYIKADPEKFTSSGLENSEEEEMRERLKGLGYLS